MRVKEAAHVVYRLKPSLIFGIVPGAHLQLGEGPGVEGGNTALHLRYGLPLHDLCLCLVLSGGFTGYTGYNRLYPAST